MSKYAVYFAIEKELKELGFDQTREEWVLAFTENQKTGLTDLNRLEYLQFINWLQVYKQNNQPKIHEKENLQRRKIISMFHKMGYQIDGKIDMGRLNNWCVSHGHLHKELMSYKGADLTKLVTQAENYYKSYISTL